MNKVLILLSILVSSLFAQQKYVNHNIIATVTPSESNLSVIDKITLNKGLKNTDIVFTLNSALKITKVLNGTASLIKTEAAKNEVGMDHDQNGVEQNLKLNKYLLEVTDSKEPVTIYYSGKIKSQLEQSEENYQRGFSQSPGIISSKGVYLAGSTYWTPTIKNQLVTFNLTAKLPDGWKTVSQGKAVGNNYSEWECEFPQEEIFLISAKFTVYKKDVGAVTAYAFLRTPDEALANKYLETTAQYLEMDRNLLGPYPYSKFALVENFWETGYGMPSFTLLGEKIIRFPFILHSSYPHELLHNWWGNSVYVDFSKGNWCEGITAYMADHLIKEQRGQGADYRRSTLQRFTDYVNDKNDFPPSEFESRYDGPSEAIGYGKTLMMWHMLRQLVGDEDFVKSFRRFYMNNKFKKASFYDIEKSFESVTGKDLSWFFKQWITRKGAPTLALSNVKVINKGENIYSVTFDLMQTQKDKPFIIDVPVAVVTKDTTIMKKFRMDNRNNTYKFTVKSKPVELIADPNFDCFRRLDANEIPSAFTKAFGSDSLICVLPAESKNLSDYKKISGAWLKGKSGKVIFDNEINTLPNYSTIWLFGKENKFLPIVNNQLKKYNSNILNDSIHFNKKDFDYNNHSFVVAVKNPDNSNAEIVWLFNSNPKAAPGLIRKLPHYGKYSFLGFEGDEPTNILKGEWPVVNSPLTYRIDKAAKVKINIHKEKALAYLAPVFSSERMFKHIEYLSSDELKGRGLGTPELEKATNYIKEKFEQYGLKPGGENETYYQTLTQKIQGKNFTITNVIGYIPGTNKNLSDAPLVVSAHYDHLGLGWPDAYKGNKGKIHHGADDNASGISVILELAKILGKNYKPARPILFIAFSGEEAGLVGSKYFVNHPTMNIKTKNIIADLNFDTVGRLFGKKIMILNWRSAREWKFIFMGIDYVTGIPTDLIKEQLDASDQVSFLEKGVPAVQFFSGPNKDYHKPTDTAEKIDKNGLVKVATAGKEVIDYLANRVEPLSNSADRAVPQKNNTDGKTRRVKTGIVPDFAYTGEGVKVSDMLDDSPASKAGIKVGDVIVKVNSDQVKNLRDYSDILKSHNPGDVITIEVRRNNDLKLIKLKLEER
jgi:aminopeptidase N